MVFLFDLGPFLAAEIFSFLEPQCQHELRKTTSAAALLFDWATEASCVPFYNVYDHATTAVMSCGLGDGSRQRPTASTRWRSYPAHVDAASERRHENLVVNVRICQHFGIACAREEEVGRSPMTRFACNKLFVTGLNGVKAIGSRFCANVAATEITFDGSDMLESIRHDFMYGCPNLKKVAFRGRMPRLAFIEHRFLADCPQLEEVDLSGLVSLVSIGKRCLSRCRKNIASDVDRALRLLIGEHTRVALPEESASNSTTDNGPLVTLEDVDVADVFCFLDPASQHELRCTSLLMTLEFDRAAKEGSLGIYACTPANDDMLWAHSSFHKSQKTDSPTVTVHVGNYCRSTLYYAWESSVASDAGCGDNSAQLEVSGYVLFELRCHKLLVTDLNGIKVIDSRFCSNVTATEIIFDGAEQLEVIGHYFIHSCPNLQKVVFQGPMPRLTNIGGFFLSECPQLQEVDFSGLVALKKIGPRCLFECTALETIDFSSFGATLEYIGNFFLSRAYKVKNLEGKLKALTALKGIDSVGLGAPEALADFAMARRAV